MANSKKYQGIHVQKIPFSFGDFHIFSYQLMMFNFLKKFLVL